MNQPASTLESRLVPPSGPVRMILDTDTYNEVDDQFALVHALLSPGRLRLEAVHAAPFLNGRSVSPEDGMLKSLEEILRVFERAGLDPGGRVRPGARSFLPGPSTPVESEASADLIALAKGAEPLYVVAIGAPTNVASALLMDPSLVSKIVVVWLGGHSRGWPDTREFNFMQDPHATRVLLDSGVPLVRLPCRGVISHMLTPLTELEAHLAGGGPVSRFLLERVRDHGAGKGPAWSKVIWDLAATAWLVNPGWMPSSLQPSPRFSDDLRWLPEDPSRHRIREVHRIYRDAVFEDFFAKLNANHL